MPHTLANYMQMFCKDIVDQALVLVDLIVSLLSKNWGDYKRSKFPFSHMKSEENESIFFIPSLDVVSI